MYRVRPLTLYPAPHGKKEIMDLLGKLKAEISEQVSSWRLADSVKVRQASNRQA